MSAQGVDERIINVHCHGATRSPGPGEDIRGRHGVASGTVPEAESEARH